LNSAALDDTSNFTIRLKAGLLADKLCAVKRNSITDILNLINGLSLLRSHLVTVGHVRTMASVSHCTRKTAMCAFARKVSQQKIARKVWSFVPDVQCEWRN